jgi:hypothetical protein
MFMTLQQTIYGELDYLHSVCALKARQQRMQAVTVAVTTLPACYI